MNKYFSATRTLFNRKLNTISKVRFSSKETSIQHKSKQYEKYFKAMTEKLNQEKEKEICNLFETMEADNYVLTSKIKSILDTNASEEVKIVSIINGVNEINIKNSEHLFKIHQRYIFNFNYYFIEFILQSYERILRIFSPKTVLTILGIYISYKYFKNNYLNGKKIDSSDVIKYYRDNPEKVFKYESNLPFFYDHKNITNLIVNGKYFLLIGPKGIGKSFSIKNFCILEAQKDSIVIYKDLNEVNSIDNIYEFICSNLIDVFKAENNLKVDVSFSELLDELKGRKVFFIMDHFLNNQKHLNSLRKVIDVLKFYNINIILLSESNKNADLALEESFVIKTIDEKIENKFNNYLLENVNHYIKNNAKYSNCELFSEKNIEELRKKHHVTFAVIIEYLNSNTNLTTFIDEQNEKITQKLRFINSNNNETIKFFKETAKIHKKPQEWIKLKEIKNYNHLLTLEKYGLIAIRNIDEIRFLSPISSELILKI